MYTYELTLKARFTSDTQLKLADVMAKLLTEVELEGIEAELSPVMPTPQRVAYSRRGLNVWAGDEAF